MAPAMNLRSRATTGSTKSPSGDANHWVNLRWLTMVDEWGMEKRTTWVDSSDINENDK